MIQCIDEHHGSTLKRDAGTGAVSKLVVQGIERECRKRDVKA